MHILNFYNLKKVILNSTLMAYYDIEEKPDVMSDISRSREIVK